MPLGLPQGNHVRVDDPDQLYQEWAQAPDAAKLNRVVRSLTPVMNHALSSIGAFDDPVLHTRAKVFTARAIQKYKPDSGANLITWTSNQLQQLRRAKREAQSAVDIPDRAKVDAFKLHQAEQEFIDKHDREPDVLELADFAKIPVSRIQKIRAVVRPVPSEGAIGGAGQVQETPYDEEALSYVHNESDHVDRRIIELKTGYGGGQPMAPQLIAQKLRMTPSQLSRRSARIALRIHELEEALRQTT